MLASEFLPGFSRLLAAQGGWASIALMVILLFSSPAQGQSFDTLSDAQKEELIMLIGQGNEAYNEGDYAGACREYERAAEIADFGEVYYRLGQCRERLDELDLAIAAYERYLELSPDISDRGRLEAEIERLRETLAARGVAHLRIETDPPGGMVRTEDGATLGTTPLELEMSPGTHDLTFNLEGRVESTRQVELAPGATVELHVELDRISLIRVVSEPSGAEVRLGDAQGPLLGLTPLEEEIEPGEYRVVVSHADAAAEQVRDVVIERGQSVDLDILMIREVHSGWLGKAGWGTLGLGALSAVGTGVLWLMAESKVEEANLYSRSSPGNTRAELQEIESEAIRRQQLTQIAGVSTAGLVVLGGTFLFLQARRGSDVSAPELTFTLTNRGAHAGFRLTF